MSKPDTAHPRQRHAAYDESYTSYQTDRGLLRQWVRRYYLRAAARLSRGPALDFGCGVGELLQRLPPQSMGVEYNLSTVKHCLRQGLDVVWYDGFKDDFKLGDVPWQGRVSTLYLCHVLEHFDDPAHILRRLAQATEPEVRRIVVIVPGQAGFRMDPTHRTFVDLGLIKRTVEQMAGWSVASSRYFPFNHPRFGDFLAHNELQVVIDREAD